MGNNGLSNKEKMRINCARCEVEMEKVVLPSYEYEAGIPLHDVEAYQCPQCKAIWFTEEQAGKLRKRTEEIKKHLFSFKRVISKSGRSLILRIPKDIVKFIGLKEGKEVQVIPVGKGRFLVKT